MFSFSMPSLRTLFSCAVPQAFFFFFVCCKTLIYLILCCLQPATCYVRIFRFLDYVCSCLLFRAPQCSLLIHSSCQPLYAVSESRRPICPSVSCAQIVASSVCALLHFRLRTRLTFRTLPYHTKTLSINYSACTALSTLGITSQLLALRLTSVIRHNAANFSGVTKGCDRRPPRPTAKPLVHIYI